MFCASKGKTNRWLSEDMEKRKICEINFKRVDPSSCCAATEMKFKYQAALQ